jgi:hypothetical protein
VFDLAHVVEVELDRHAPVRAKLVGERVRKDLKSNGFRWAPSVGA